MADELSQEQLDALAVISTAREAARSDISQKMADLVSDIDALSPLYPDGFTPDISQVRNFVNVWASRFAPPPATEE